MNRPCPFGAYGLRLTGLDDDLLVQLPVDNSWPHVRVRHGELTHLSGEVKRIGSETAEVRFLDGSSVSMDRSRRLVTLGTAMVPDDGRILHPLLSAIGIVFAWWDGRHAFHAGAFLDGRDRAWGVVGERGFGKSSSLAGLHQAGLRVVSDDLLVVAEGEALAGPRCIDLRPEVATALKAKTTLVRAGARSRLTVGPVPEAAELHGWLFLKWGEHAEERRLKPSDLLPKLAAHRNTRSGGSPTLLALADKEAWEITRRPRWESFQADVERLLALVDR